MWLGLDAGCVVDDPAVVSDAELHRRLWALHRWITRVEATDYPVIWALAKQAGAFDGAALKEWEDVAEAIAMWRASLAWYWEIEANMKGAMA